MSAIKNKPTSTTIEALTAIWQRTLQLPAVGTDENFFDLGGDSATALELFSAIAQAFHRELPPVTIYQASTITTLAFLLEETGDSKFPAIVLLKSGNQDPPLFLTHGLGGTVIDFYQVVRHIETPRPIYGMQARGVDGVDTAFDRIEDMAQYYLDAVKKVQPAGPYLLAGYSLGGLVTLEMAQRLATKGEKVALLALLDAYPHVLRLSRGQRSLLTWQKARREISAILKLPLRSKLHVLAHPSERKALLPPDPYQALAEAPLSLAMQEMRDRAYLALQCYQPPHYPGKIHFVKAGVITCFPANPRAIWKKYADALELTTLPADHLGIMTTHASQTAAVLSQYIKEVCA